MIEVKNKTRGPVQIVIRSRTPVKGSGSKAFTTKIIPGIGKGKHIYYLADELHTEWVDRAEKNGFITTKRVPDNYKINDQGRK